MFTTYTETTSAARDHIPGDKVEILNHMCVLVLTKGNGTLFDATSIQEGIIDICIQLGQTHSKGMLQYSAGESVILFQSVEEMLVTAHRVIKRRALCEEPIRLRMSPPSATHARAFMAAKDGELSGTQPPTPNRGKEPLPSPNDSHLGGRTHVNCRWTLGMREGGDPEDSHFDPLLPPNQMKGENPEDNPFDPLLPPNQMKM